MSRWNLGSLALKCHFLSLKGAFLSKNDVSCQLLFFPFKRKDTKSPLIWHLFLTTNDRGAMELINRNEKSLLGLDYHESIVKVTSRGLGCHKTIGKMTDRDLGCHESIVKVASRGLGCHDPIGKVTSRDLGYHESIGKVTGRGLGHYKTSLNTNN